MRTRRLYRLLLLAAGAAVVALALVGYATGALRRADLSTVDARFSIRGDRKPPGSIVFVKIDDETFNHLTKQFPLPRKYHAKVIDNIARDGAKAIAYDVQFTEPGPDPNQDNQLIQSVRGAGNVVLATTEFDRHGGTRIFGGGQGLKYSRAVPSDSEYPNDPGGIIRRMEFGVGRLRSFPLAAAQLYEGHRIATPGGRTAWIDYPGGPGTIRSLSFWRAESGRFPPGTFRGKIAVVGASAPSLQDLHPTSVTGSDPMPGPEIHAAAIDTVLRGFPLSAAPGWVNVAIIVLMGLAAPLLALRTSGVRAVLITLALTIALAVVAQLLFDGGTIISLVYAGLAALLSAIATIVLFGVATAFERERTRATFARFVPENVVSEVLETADGARLGGIAAECTLLFSDLRGFTSFSEPRPPELVIDLLNRYLTAMSDAIMDNGGTLVAYMGDGIMAVFGAPVAQEDHADRAYAAARDMLSRCADFNRWLRDEGLANGFKMGIGLNSGRAMSGMVGSERRLEYTAIGDVTNTASRLESMTKESRWQLYISDTTRAAMTRPPEDLMQVGEFEVRGREAKIKVWTVPASAYEPVADDDSPTGAVPAAQA